MKAKSRKVKIGVVGVDSGQLMICDPCYIDSEWEKEEFKDTRIYENIFSGDRLQYPKDFPHFESVIEKYGKTMNQLNETGEWKKVKTEPAKENFSYNAVCRQTLDDERKSGQLNYRMGHPGVAVAFRSGLGDGVYDVYAKIEEVEGWGERVTKVWIELL